MDKAEQVAINHVKLKSAVFHLNAAYKQVGDTYNCTLVYDAIYKALGFAKTRLSTNETST